MIRWLWVTTLLCFLSFQITFDVYVMTHVLVMR